MLEFLAANGSQSGVTAGHMAHGVKQLSAVSPVLPLACETKIVPEIVLYLGTYASTWARALCNLVSHISSSK
jgi:hypothetical protein